MCRFVHVLCTVLYRLLHHVFSTVGCGMSDTPRTKALDDELRGRYYLHAFTGPYDEMLALSEALERQACHHGWRGYAPEDGKRIVTPCPACGGQLFIGAGGHLTCANVGSSHGSYSGCPEPSVEQAIENLKDKLAAAVKAGDA